MDFITFLRKYAYILLIFILSASYLYFSFNINYDKEETMDIHNTQTNEALNEKDKFDYLLKSKDETYYDYTSIPYQIPSREWEWFECCNYAIE